MAKVALISLYDSWALGLRVVSNALYAKGHDVAVIHFKIAFQKQLKDFLKHPIAYENSQSRESHSEVIIRGYNMDVNMWTQNECMLLGDILEDIAPDIIGITTRSVYEKLMGPIFEQMRRVPSAITMAGGFGATLNPAWYFDKVDYVCLGDGESAVVGMAECIDNHAPESIRGVPNLTYKHSGQVVFNPMEKPDDSGDYFYHSEMHKIPHYVIEDNRTGKTDVFMDYVRRIDPTYAGSGNYYTMLGRGCMWNCSFCSAGRFYDVYNRDNIVVKRRRNRRIDQVIAELKLAREHNFTKIFFMDSFLVGESSYLLDFFDAYKREVGLPFFAQLLPEQVFLKPEVLDKAVDAGMTFTVIGIQSGSERVNKTIYNRKISSESILKFAEMVVKYDNVQLDYHIITHNPLETMEDIKEAFDLVARLPRKNAQLVLQRLRPFPGSEISDLIQKAHPGNVDEEFYHKIYMLYLLRFHMADREFENIFADMDRYSHIDLMDMYVEIKKTYKNAADWIRLGWEYYHKIKYSEALRSFTKALDMDSAGWEALNGRGWTYYQSKDYKNAFSDFENALKLIPVAERNLLQEVNRGLGWVNYCEQAYDSSILYFLKALEHADNKAAVILQDIYRGLGWAYYRKSDAKTAEDFFSKAIDNIDSADTAILQDAMNGLSKVHSLTKKG